VDREIVRQTGRTIAELFQTDGEKSFRAMESRLTAELSSVSGLVLAPGGGWAAQPGTLSGLPPETAVVWLRVSPEEALRRLRGSPEQRPLLAGPDPLGAMQALAEQRRHAYERADLTVDVDGRSAAETADMISAWLNRSTS
jgi:shikimate kinase